MSKSELYNLINKYIDTQVELTCVNGQVFKGYLGDLISECDNEPNGEVIYVGDVEIPTSDIKSIFSLGAKSIF